LSQCVDKAYANEYKTTAFALMFRKEIISLRPPACIAIWVAEVIAYVKRASDKTGYITDTPPRGESLS
jgi:hypothetical protein